VPSNQTAEGFEFCSLIGLLGCRGCNWKSNARTWKSCTLLVHHVPPFRSSPSSGRQTSSVPRVSVYTSQCTLVSALRDLLREGLVEHGEKPRALAVSILILCPSIINPVVHKTCVTCILLQCIHGFHSIFSLWQLKGKGSYDVDIDQSAGSMVM